MKKLIVVSKNHMDPSWRRCFTDHYTYRGDVIRPYTDIEEELICQHLDFMKQGDWKYGMEQSLVLRRFLERNPDREDEVKARIDEGKLELLGGGETVIDYNLISGESIYRNHYYSIQYYEETFGCRPRYVDCPDSFGLSAQLPQIFRQFGYEAVTQYDRVFQNNKPVWCGLDGTPIVLWTVSKIMSHHYPDCYKYTACGMCHGEGCESCHGTGIDFSYDYSYHEQPRGDREGLVFYAGPSCSTEEYVKRFAASEDEVNILYVSSEETRHIDSYPTKLRALCEQNGIELCPMTHAELLETTAAEALAAVRKGDVPADMIDPRVEGNPVATGCYTSRIELKRKNRMLEQLVLSAEKLAAMTYAPEAYPHKAFARMWRLLSFLQFHDCVTASHCDASYEELLRVCRDIYSAAGRIRHTAMQTLAASLDVKPRNGWQSVVVFNPTSKEWNDVPLSAIVRQRDVFSAVELCDTQGNDIPVLSLNVHNNALDCSAEVTFRSSIAAMSPLVVYWRVCDPTDAKEEQGDTIENEYFTVNREGIFDKLRGRKVMGANAGGLALSHDFGHAWGKLAEREWAFDLPDTTVSMRRQKGAQHLILHGGYTDPARGVETLTWTRRVTLYDGVDKIFWRTELDWKGENVRISARFPLAIDHGEGGMYEIPYGMVERPDAIEPSQMLGIEDEWPAFNWFSAYDKEQNYSAVIFNKGTPGCRIENDCMEMSLLRSPTVLEFANEGARDHGHHIFEYALAVCDGTPDVADPTAFGLRYTTPIPSVSVAHDEVTNVVLHEIAGLSTDATSVHITAIKRDANGRLILRAVESYGKAATLFLPVPAVLVDPLEKNELAAANERIIFRPFEIKTLRLCDAN